MKFNDQIGNNLETFQNIPEIPGGIPQKLLHWEATQQCDVAHHISTNTSSSESSSERRKHFSRRDYTTPSWSYKQRMLQVSPRRLLQSLAATRDIPRRSFEHAQSRSESRIEREKLRLCTTITTKAAYSSFVFEFSIRLDRSVERLR